MARNPNFKCTFCGKFVSYSGIEDGSVVVDFTPDTYYTNEKTEMYHKKCKND